MAQKFNKLRSITPAQYATIRDAAYQTPGHEACGVLVGRIEGDTAIIEHVRVIRNISNVPEFHFMMHPEDYLAAILDTTWYEAGAAYELLGMWHTHPNFPGYPSSYDWNAALNGESIHGAYLLFTTKGNDIYQYYWDGKQFTVLQEA